MISLLRNVNNGSVFYLVNKEQFVVGRKDCDLLISNDQSISRKHAVIRIKDGKVSVEDFGSKYNTLHNETKISPNTETPLNYGDTIQFGVINSKYRLEQLSKIVTTGTRLNSSQKIQLKNDLATIGGQYIESWTSDCTHLTVQEITLTVKILHATIDEKPIVKPTYWTKYAENIGRNLPPPVINDEYKPPIAEALLNNVEFKIDPNRRSLFKGKLFVFSKETSKKQMEEIIRKVGGISISWEKDPMPIDDIKTSPKEFIIIQPTDNISDDSDLNQVIKHFSKQGKRTIPLQEIAMAIVLCSCEKNCNPNFNRVDEVFLKKQPKQPTQSNALVLNTESQYFTTRTCKEEEDEVHIIIPGTLDSDTVQLKNEPCKQLPKEEVPIKQGFKRLFDDLPDNPVKKPKVEDTKAVSTVKQERKDTFLTKDKPSQKKLTEYNESVASASTSKVESEQNPFIKKEKIKTDIKVGKSENPFLSSKKHSEDVTLSKDENPFLSKGSNKRFIEDEVFSPFKKTKKESIFTSTRISDNLDISNNFPKLSKISKTDNSTWLSKDTISDASTHFKENLETTFDVEMQKFIDQFKGTVVVEVITKIPVRSRVYHDVVDGGKHSQRRNFKRFVKVKPIRPQRIIIGEDNCIAVGPRDTTGIVDSRKEHYMSDDEADGSVKVKKKATKKFCI